MGDRKRLLRAIASLTTERMSSVAGAAAGPSPTDAERRQITVLFSDLVGSTALSACLDPEDLREIISAYQKCAAETVRRFDGYVAKYLGDGVLVYFGYPQAHEDDAERAVRAGLELISATSGLKTRASLQSRVGIATGLVVVGDLIGSGEAQERGIVGETPNLAARWCCSRASRASADPGLRPRYWNALGLSRTRGCVISARRSTPTARFFRSSARCNAPPDWRTTTRWGRGSTSSTLCWRKLRRLLSTPH
jgi:hypothetical protein